MAPTENNPAAAAPEMSTPAARSGSTSKQIPLVCTVCPETPRFSDVSHLLTHIASKGHLHQETQTKLKARQNTACSATLRQYDQWYQEHGIEDLLVGRMQTKQAKEAAKNKRARAPSVTPAPAKQGKKKGKQARPAAPENVEQGSSRGIPVFPGFLAPEPEPAGQEKSPASGAMMTLKGQVWPGMGKMDLASEDMKRTRNQRKPKSAIEKMRRTSEGIAPTQVVMTPDFQVKRVKDVYDSSSPAPEQEEPTPVKKPTRGRRKRADALAQLSSNVPVANRRVTRAATVNTAATKPNNSLNRTANPEVTPAMGHFKRPFDVFRDNDEFSGLMEDRSLPFATRDTRFDMRGRAGFHQPNPLSHSSLVSPTPTSRDMIDRNLQTRDVHHNRNHTPSYFTLGNNQPTLGNLHPDMSYAFNDYNNPSRFSMGSENQFNPLGHDHYPNAHHSQYPNPVGPDTGNTNHYFNMSGNNPLFSQDRLFLGTCNQAAPTSALASMAYNSMNRNRDQIHHGHYDPNNHHHGNSVKMETHLGGVVNGTHHDNSRNMSYNTLNPIWDNSAAGSEIDLTGGIQGEELDM